jgi:hypothetical protein
MFSLAKWILTKYKTVVIQMFDEQASHDIAKASLELFCDVEIFLGLTCIILMLKLIHGYPSLLKIGTSLYSILLLLSKNVKCNYIRCIVINKPCMGITSLGNF